MSEPKADVQLLVTLRVYGQATTEDVAAALRNHPDTFGPGDWEAEILEVQQAPFAAGPAAATTGGAGTAERLAGDPPAGPWPRLEGDMIVKRWNQKGPAR